jgi:hypothetical protein
MSGSSAIFEDIFMEGFRNRNKKITNKKEAIKLCINPSNLHNSEVA